MEAVACKHCGSHILRAGGHRAWRAKALLRRRRHHPVQQPRAHSRPDSTLPAFRIGWQTGVENLLLVSIGTGFERITFKKRDVERIHLLDHARYVPAALVSSIAIEQDLLCRIIGECRFGAALDSELGDLIGPGVLTQCEKKFAYVRYNRLFSSDETLEMARRTGQEFTLDNIDLIPYLQQAGSEYAASAVAPEHLSL